MATVQRHESAGVSHQMGGGREGETSIEGVALHGVELCHPRLVAGFARGASCTGVCLFYLETMGPTVPFLVSRGFGGAPVGQTGDEGCCQASSRPELESAQGMGLCPSGIHSDHCALEISNGLGKRGICGN